MATVRPAKSTFSGTGGVAVSWIRTRPSASSKAGVSAVALAGKTQVRLSDQRDRGVRDHDPSCGTARGERRRSEAASDVPSAMRSHSRLSALNRSKMPSTLSTTPTAPRERHGPSGGRAGSALGLAESSAAFATMLLPRARRSPRAAAASSGDRALVGVSGRQRSTMAAGPRAASPSGEIVVDWLGGLRQPAAAPAVGCWVLRRTALGPAAASGSGRPTSSGWRCRARQPATGPNRSSQCRGGGSGATQGWIGRVTGSWAGGSTPSDSGGGNRLPAPHELVHPGLRLGGYLDLLPEQAEDLMDARGLGEVDVGGQALLLVLRDLIGLEVVVDVAGDEVGIGRVRARLARHRVPPLARDAVDPVDQLRARGFRRPACRSRGPPREGACRRARRAGS